MYTRSLGAVQGGRRGNRQSGMRYASAGMATPRQTPGQMAAAMTAPVTASGARQRREQRQQMRGNKQLFKVEKRTLKQQLKLAKLHAKISAYGPAAMPAGVLDPTLEATVASDIAAPATMNAPAMMPLPSELPTTYSPMPETMDVADDWGEPGEWWPGTYDEQPLPPSTQQPVYTYDNQEPEYFFPQDDAVEAYGQSSLAVGVVGSPPIYFNPWGQTAVTMMPAEEERQLMPMYADEDGDEFPMAPPSGDFFDEAYGNDFHGGFSGLGIDFSMLTDFAGKLVGQAPGIISAIRPPKPMTTVVLPPVQASTTPGWLVPVGLGLLAVGAVFMMRRR